MGVSDVPAVVEEVGQLILGCCMSELNRISIVIPVFNEEGNLLRLRAELLATMNALHPIAC